MERESYLFIFVNGKNHRFILFAHKNNLSGESASRKSSGHAGGGEFDLKKKYTFFLKDSK